MNYFSGDIAKRIKLLFNSINEKPYKVFPEKLGLAKNTLNNFRSSMPKADNLAKIADYLNYSVDYLLGRTPCPDINISGNTQNNVNGDINIVPPKEPMIQDNTADLIKREENKLKRIKEAYLNGIDTIEEYKTNKQKITANLEKLKAKQKKPEPKPELETRRYEFIKLFDKGNATPAELNTALKSFIAYIIYSRPDDSITLFLNP